MASEIRVNKIANRAGLSTVEYTDTGIIVSGIVTCTEISGLNALNIAGVSTFASPLDINGDIDVDGHTNLDNLSVAGVSTFSGEICLDTHPTRIKSSAGDLEIGVGTTSSFFITGGPYSAERLETTVDCVILYSAGSKVARTHNGRFEVGNPAAATGIGATLSITGGANFAGIVTASAFKLSDGSNVGGVESDAQFNTVSGTNAGDSFSGTDAQRNTLIGYNAGTNISSADDNTAVGHNALLSQTTGNRNVALGSNVMDASTTAANNVAIGYNAMTKATNNSCNKNVAIGYEAATELTTGQRNVLIGHYAGYDLQSGSFNTCVGDFAGANLSNSSNDNTCIGQNAGFSLNGSNNILIGHDATESTYTISNEITLGDSNISHLRVPGIGVSFGRSGATIAGVVTATSFSGDGSSLSNLPAGAPVGGASTNTVFFENDKAVAVNYQVTSTKNAMSAGPIAINAGIAVTVPSGCSWTIV